MNLLEVFHLNGNLHLTCIKFVCVRNVPLILLCSFADRVGLLSNVRLWKVFMKQFKFRCIYELLICCKYVYVDQGGR